jgi:DNA-binding IclR family transcriptional regulator
MEGEPTDDAPRKGARRIDLPSSDVIERASVQSVAIAARILKALAGAGGVLALKDLAAATGMPRSKVHRYLVSLRSTGLISQEADGGRYRIGPAAVTIGLVGLGRMGPVRQLNEAVPRLRDRINETVTAAIWSDNGPTIIAMEESDHLVTMNLRIGSVLPLINTAIGRLFLGYLPSAMTQRLVAAERRAAASLRASLPSDSELADILADIRRKKLSRVRGALLPGVDALAAPVFDYRAQLVAVMCVVARTESAVTGPDGPVAKALSAAANDLSGLLGLVERQKDKPKTKGRLAAARTRLRK